MKDEIVPRDEGYYPRVHVTGGDYSYFGYLTAVFRKRRGGLIRCVVEDENGRLFIHNSKQVNHSDDELIELGVKFKLIVA